MKSRSKPLDKDCSKDGTLQAGPVKDTLTKVAGTECRTGVIGRHIMRWAGLRLCVALRAWGVVWNSSKQGGDQ